MLGREHDGRGCEDNQGEYDARGTTDLHVNGVCRDGWIINGWMNVLRHQREIVKSLRLLTA